MNPNRFRVVTLAAAVVAAVAAAPTVLAADVAAPPPVTPAVTIELLHGGPGNQTDPHISGTLVSYLNRPSFQFSEIRYADVTTGSNAAIPNEGGAFGDAVSDIHGSTIVFRRADPGLGRQAIFAFDTTRPDDAPRELDPDGAARRTQASIGGGTVAWQEARGTTTETEIVVHDLATGATQALTSEGVLFDMSPAVSPDGSVVVWQRCTSHNTAVGCEMLWSLRGPDGWSAPVTRPGGGNQATQDTNGSLIVYADNASGDYDLHWVNVDGSGAGRLVSAGTDEFNPNISGSFVTFERVEPGESNADVYGYDLDTGVHYRLTDTPDVDEHFNDVSVGADGIARVVFARSTPDAGDDVYVASFQLRSSPSLEQVFYLHNRPTPPAGNTNAQAGLPLTTAAPTATQLRNYAADLDGNAGVTGRFLDASSSGLRELDLQKFQTWSSGPLDSDLVFEGDAQLSIWAKLKQPNKTIQLRAYVSECSEGLGCTHFATGEMTPLASASSTEFGELILTFDGASNTIEEGNELLLRIVILDVPNKDQVYLAYDTLAFPSRLVIGD